MATEAAVQAEQLDRVGERIGHAVMLFFARRVRETPRFHAEDLRTFIRLYVGEVAPGSPDRIMRQLRQARKIDYRCVDRKNSQYEIVPIES
jgi:hypothetical protein